MKLSEQVSLPSQNKWTPWDERTEKQALTDFNTLMRNTTFLEDMRIEVNDYTFPNGAVGKIVSYIAEERERVKIVDYREDGEPIKTLKRSDIDDKLREKSVDDLRRDVAEMERQVWDLRFQRGSEKAGDPSKIRVLLKMPARA